MTDESSHSKRIDTIADEYLARKRRGESPTIKEYCMKYPDLAEDIRELFPTLEMMEDLMPAMDSTSGAEGVPSTVKRIGDYRILGEIGRGGMGVVYEAEQESLGRRVALKVLSKRFSHDDSGLVRFQREARAAARMHHTNIVPVFEIGQESGYAFYAMQLIQGQSLDRVIKDLVRLRADSEARKKSDHRGGSPPGESPPTPVLQDSGIARSDALAHSLVTGRFHTEVLVESSPWLRQSGTRTDTDDRSIKQGDTTASAVLRGGTDLSTIGSRSRKYYRSVANIGRQVAEALAYSHARGVVHRDIKPSNLLLDTGGTVWITDFGIARSDEQNITHTGDIVGTIRYMSPGRLRGRWSELSDIYALGLTLYELLVLRPAFDSTDRLELMEMIKESEPAVPRSIDPHIPIDMETIILKAIDKEPTSRYQSADDMAEDLRRFIEDEPIRARRVSIPGRLVRWTRRNRKLAISLSTVALLIFILAIVSTISAFYYRHQEHKQIELRQVAERNLYFAEMNLAGQAAHLPSGTSQIQQITDRWSPNTADVDLYGWEWFFLRSLCQREELALKQDSTYSGVAEAAWNPQGTMVALAHIDGKVTVWNALTGKQKLVLDGHTDKVFCVSWSLDGRTIASGGADKTVRLWDAISGKTTRLFEASKGFVRVITHSPDGRKIAWGGGASLYVYDLTQETPPVMLTGGPEMILTVQWSPDSAQIACGNWWDNSIRIWDIATRSAVRHLSARYVKWSPTGHDVENWVSSTPWGDIQVWDADTGKRIGNFIGHSGFISSISWSPDGADFVSASRDQTFRLWNLSSGRMIRNFMGHTGEVRMVHWSPDGTHLVSASRDGTAKIWAIKENVKVSFGENLTPVRWLAQPSQLIG